MTFEVGKILGTNASYNAGGLRNPSFILANNFVQQSVSANQTYNLNHPAQANSIPFGESPRANYLDILA